ncbi:restriction endonuclease subunit S [Providencia stuartii]|uniref:restriction endonuclease subunit S n=1 Tax=Providencia stuartii TaxID=588 RepID=UPI001BCF0ECA|nr:restriction endonuclease subunit S [Providencia thailandensis]MBS7784534.1 restriction endonuclease subunit S [Providencia thailandensis]
MSEWVELKLTEVGSLQRGKSKHRPRYAFHLYNGKYPFIQTGEVRESRKYISEFKNTYSEAGLAQSKLWPKNTLCITIAANIAELGILKFDACFPDSVIGFIPDKNKSNLDFVYYTLCHFQRELKHLGEGSVQDNINLGTFNDIKFMFPSLAEQKSIASVLSSLDDKIDLLHRQNKTLEAMAETLFRQWFVEEAQDDWEEVTLSDVCHRITDGAHASPKSIENGWAMASVKDMETWGINYDTCRRISKEDYDELVRADCKALKGDILIAKDGSYLKHVFLLEKDIDVVLLSSIAMLRPNGKYDPMLLTIFLKMNSTREEMENIVTGAVIPRIVLKDFRKFPIRLPPREYQTKALIQISPIFRKCWLNNSQIKKLENLRDTLLPKLMSGEVRVNYTPEEIKQ